MKILFIGGTGMLGQPVVRELNRQGFDLTLLARDPEKAASLFPGIRVLKGDILEPGRLHDAMQDTEVVYCNLSVLPSSREKDPQPEREGINNILAATRKTGVKRIIYLSSLVHRYQGMNGFNWWAFAIKASAVRKIRESGIPYTIFYPSTFMECFPFQMLRGRKIAALGHSRMPMWFIAGIDYARQVAASLRMPGDDNREYAVQGPAPYTFDQANLLFAAHYRKAKLGILRAPVALMKCLGFFAQPYNYAWHICEALNNYPETFESGETWKALGNPSLTLEQYAAGL